GPRPRRSVRPSPSPVPAAASEPVGPSPPPWRSPPVATGVRHLVLAGMTASVLVAYLPRTALGPAASSIKRELGLSDLAVGEVLGVWALGYLLLQLPGGWLGDRFGRRVMLPLYGVAWAVCTLGTAGPASLGGF